MVLTHCCIISGHVKELTGFYEHVLQIQPQRLGEDSYNVFETEKGILTIYKSEEHNGLVPHSAEPSKNRSILLEFEVDNVDEEYERLKKMEIEWVQIPVTQPWGARAIYFRDPDGNLLRFYSRGENDENS